MRFFCRTEIGAKCKKIGSDYKQEIMAALCGATVITHYNRKTYRIDDVDFSLTPLSKFDQNGTEVNFYIVFFLFICF